ncbi:hypothetical protein NECAME_15673 [Necator americanus]|uniref:Uncharacterized protein n=1 Tax=Necator americanus TaxID=51031 RepID=W2SIM6_NECAM|nr:hypothetical protein NECAME_15673 [Necator americanus]ETN68721.1 hypothetical protein NECAME_15673 [Necator americanus]
MRLATLLVAPKNSSDYEAIESLYDLCPEENLSQKDNSSETLRMLASDHSSMTSFMRGLESAINWPKALAFLFNDPIHVISEEPWILLGLQRWFGGGAPPERERTTSPSRAISPYRDENDYATIDRLRYGKKECTFFSTFPLH